jgi:hypothetical protein
MAKVNRVSSSASLTDLEGLPILPRVRVLRAFGFVGMVFPVLRVCQ